MEEHWLVRKVCFKGMSSVTSNLPNPHPPGLHNERHLHLKRWKQTHFFHIPFRSFTIIALYPKHYFSRLPSTAKTLIKYGILKYWKQNSSPTCCRKLKGMRPQAGNFMAKHTKPNYTITHQQDAFSKQKKYTNMFVLTLQISHDLFVRK